VKSVDALKCS